MFISEWVKVSHSYPTICNPIDGSPPGSSVHGILQARYWSGLPLPSAGDLPTQSSGLDLLHCRLIVYHLSHQGSRINVYSSTVYNRRHGNNPGAQQQLISLRRYDAYIQWNITQPWKEWNIGLCSSMDAQWNKSKTNIIWYHLCVESKKVYKWIYI